MAGDKLEARAQVHLRCKGELSWFTRANTKEVVAGRKKPLPNYL